MGRTENLIDPPLTEMDCKMVHIFHVQFLGKDGSDSLALLKSITLLRRSDLREHIHNCEECETD